MAAPTKASTDSTLTLNRGFDRPDAAIPLLNQVRPDDSLLALYERTRHTFADRIAIACGTETATYAKLDAQADHIAHHLQKLGVKPGNIVAIYYDRSITMVAAMLGVIKAGAAYLPIDPGYPQARVAQTLEDAKPAVLITSSQLKEQLPPIEIPVFLADQTTDNTESLSFESETRPTNEDLAYLMYTSGSTGKPKGVLVTHRNVVRLMTETDAWFRFDESDVWTMFHSFAFDFSVWEIWGPLTTGGKLVIVPFATSRSPEDFYSLLSEQRVTVLNQTPSAFSLITQLEDSGKALPLALRYVIFGGEALQYRALKSWFKRHGESNPTLINMYGITETTVHVTYRVVREADTHGEADSLIGVPIPDLQIHLLDSNLKPVEPGETGEICVGGSGVALGYLNRPELTAERFVQNPFSDAGTKVYRSGDLARRRDDGELVYLGRGDNQVKINGFRIELGEVESAVSDYPGVKQVSVIAHATNDGRQRLAAYFVMTGPSTPAPREMSSFLSSRLPPQMMPAFYCQLPSMPLTGNGKIDRTALPKPEAGSREVEGASPESGPIGQGNSSEELIADIWRVVLDAKAVGRDDNFFDIGGTSVLLASVRSQLQQKLNRTIPVTWMFEFTTIRTLAERLSLEEKSSSLDSGSSTAVNAAQEQARRQREAFARMKAAKGLVR
jgi:amino acid adenylation domain-containing protein